MAKLTLVYGAAGTGKTSKLLAILKDRLTTIRANEIAYVSFTRKGTYAGVDLAKEYFNLTEEDCEYFKTLHSLAYHALGLSADVLMSEKDEQKIAHHFNVVPDDYDAILTAVSVAENRDLAVTPEYAQNVYKDAYEFGNVYTTRTAYKERLGKLDFSDLLRECVSQQVRLPVKLVFIDEAQDLTTLQWRLAKTLFAEAEEWVVAGDPNQAIYKWAGADVAYFLGLTPDNVIALPKSHRCSRAVWHLAQTILYTTEKSEKVALPNECSDVLGFAVEDSEVGLNERHVRRIIATEKSAFFLALAGSYLDDYIAMLSKIGVPFMIKRGAYEANYIDPMLRRRLSVAYNALTTKQGWDKYVLCTTPINEHDKIETDVLDLFTYLGLTRKPYTLLNNDDRLTYIVKNVYKWAVKKYGNKTPIDAILCACRALVRGTITIPANRYIVSTVHKMKGDEADYVMLCRNAGKYGFLTDEERAELNRVLYVGVTRARTGVIIWRKRNAKIDTTKFLDSNIGELQAPDAVLNEGQIKALKELDYVSY